MSLSSGVNIANEGEGFFTTPGRTASGKLQRTISPSFSDLWSQPRLFFNSLVPTEQQFLINAIRFETANVKSTVVRNNIVIQLNRISNDVAKRVARALNVEEPQPDPTYYHDNKTTDVGVFGTKLKRLDGLKIGVLASVAERSSIDEANALRSSFASDDVDVIVVAERFEAGVDQTYSASDAINFDAIIVADGADGLFAPNSITVNAPSTLYPAGRPLQILLDGFRFGKPVGALGTGAAALDDADILTSRAGVYVAESPVKEFVDNIKEGLATFKFLDRFELDEE